MRGQVGVEMRSRSGHARHRDIVEKATRGACNFAASLNRSRRREQLDDVESVRSRRTFQFASFLWRQIHDEERIDAGARRVGAQLLASIVKYWVVVSVQD